MDRRLTFANRLIRSIESGADLPRARTLADERLGRVLKRAVGSEPVPDSLETSIRRMLKAQQIDDDE